MNIKQTTAAIKALGLIAERHNGEWQIRYRAKVCKIYDLDREATDYFTCDNADALATAQKMAEWLAKFSRRIEHKLAA